MNLVPVYVSRVIENHNMVLECQQNKYIRKTNKIRKTRVRLFKYSNPKSS